MRSDARKRAQDALNAAHNPGASETTEQRIAAILDAHTITIYPSRPMEGVCDCGVVTTCRAERVAHLAAVLVAAGVGFDLTPVHAARTVLAQVRREAAAEALREFADTRGVNVGDDSVDWWQGYRQAQRECLREAADRAEQIGGGQ